MTLYFCFLILVGILSIFAIVYPGKPFFLIFFMALFLFSALRFEIGWDWEQYNEFFNIIRSSSDPVQTAIAGGELNFDYGFGLFALSALISPQLPIIAGLGIYLSGVYRFLGLLAPSEKVYGAIIFLWYGYFEAFSIQRQIISVGLALHAIVLLVTHRKILRATMLTAASITFHKVSALILPLIGLLTFSNPTSPKFMAVSAYRAWTIMFAAILCLSLSVFGESVLSSLNPILTISPHFQELNARIEYYLSLSKGDEVYSTAFTVRTLEYFIVYAFAAHALTGNLQDKKSKTNQLALILGGFHLVIYSSVCGLGLLGSRIDSALVLFHVFLMARLLGKFFTNLSNACILCCGLLVVVFLRYWRLFYTSVDIPGGHFERFFPYKFFFLHG